MALYQVTVAPTTYPVSANEVKDHLRIPYAVTTWDTLISSLIKSSTLWAENHTQRLFVQSTVRQWLDSFPSGLSAITLYGNRAIDDATFELVYWDADNAEQTLVKDTDYSVETVQEPGSVYLPPDVVWPSTKSGKRNAVRVTYNAGFGATVPEGIKQALLLIIGDWYSNPGNFEQTTTSAAIRILDQYKIVW